MGNNHDSGQILIETLIVLAVMASFLILLSHFQDQKLEKNFPRFAGLKQDGEKV